MTGAPVIELRAVHREHPGGVRALRDVTLAVHAGELVGIVGPSGSGKSTLLHIIGTLDRASSGVVRVCGLDLDGRRDRDLSGLRASAIGFVFQQFHLPSGVSAVDAVADGLIYSGVPLARRRRRATEALDRVGLAHRRHHRPHELSGGERQRVAIARAVVHEPDLLLADEPTGSLDSRSGGDVIELLRELNTGGTTVLVITHALDLAASLPRRVALADGRIVHDGASAPSEVTT